MPGLPAVTKTDVLAAITAVLADGVPKGRGSKKFCLVIGAAHLPPKYTLGVAVQGAVGRAPKPDEFSGGDQTNAILTKLGFGVRLCNCGGSVRSVPRGPAQRRLDPRRLRKRMTVPLLRDADAAGVTPIVRIVSRGRPPSAPKLLERMLLHAFGPKWPRGVKAKFVITPGGFVTSQWPDQLVARTGWDSRSSDVAAAARHAADVLKRIVSPRVLDAAQGKAEVLTIGIDLVEGPGDSMAELVAVYDVPDRRLVRWTGKSYPTPGRQERVLVHVTDLDSHLLTIARERVLVLGCHDLNMFSPRSEANQSPDGLRRKRCNAMKAKVARFKPTVVLQHPHSTDTPNIWRMPWLSLKSKHDSIKTWASGIAYFNEDGPQRAELSRVLDLTKSDAGQVVDIIVSGNAFS